MHDSTARTRAARLLAVLALVLGLVAMHGVAGAHHAAASTPATSHATVASAEQPGVGAAHQHVTAQQEAVDPRSTVWSASGLSCDDGCASVAALCVAVLVSAAVALLLSTRHRNATPAVPSGDITRAPAPPSRHARGPDPVRELCISRT